MTKRKTLDAASIRRYAVAADVDPRTILNVLNGHPTNTMSSRRAANVLREAGKLPKEGTDHEE